MTQNLKFKIKQFEWFQMQTKVRQIIQQVLGPIQKRILQTSATLNKVKTSQIEDQQKIQQIILMVANDPKVFETGIFATVDKKFVQHSKLIQQLSRQVEQQNKYVQNKFKILDLRMEESSQVLKNVASLKQRVSKQIQIQNDNINALRTNLQKMIQDLNHDIRDTRTQIMNNAQISQKRDSSIQQQIRRIKQNILTIEDNLSLQRQMHKQKTIKLQQHERTIQRHTEEIKQLFDNKYLTKRLGDLVQDMDNQIKKTLFKVDCILPLITQAQISQCLSAILPNKIRHKICIYQHKKYSSLNKEVLEKDYRKVQTTFKGIQLLQNMQKKCTKQIVQLKRKKLLQMGIDIDHATYEQRQKYYNQISLDDQLNMDIQQTKVTQKVDQGEIRKIMQRYLSQYMKEFKQQINMEVDDNKKYIYGVEDQIRHQVSKFDKTIQSVRNYCTAFHTQHMLEIKAINGNILIHEQMNKSMQDKLIEIHSLQRLFYNFCSLMNHLSIQDEIDKQNISLMGAKQSGMEEININKQRNTVIALDGKCFSCNGYPATTLTAFKMACLAYHPSTIKIDTKQYKREQLLQFTTNMLQNIKKSIQQNTNLINIPQKTFTLDQYLPQQNVHSLTQIKYSKQIKKSSTLIIKSMNNSLEDQNERPFRNTQISKHLQTEDCVNDQRVKSMSKYRKKTLNTTYSTCYTKNKTVSHKKHSMNEQMLKNSVIFNNLRKKNSSFLIN